MAVLTASLARLRADFNAAHPNRDRTSDGWIGDTAHQASVSGHNPDDTAGSKSEYADADTKAEVRAVDVDADLRGGRTMQQEINRILATPRDLRRLRYMIFNRVIWSASNNWVGRQYFGDNPHDKHAHFSGNPDTDEDASPWSVAASTGADMELNTPIPEPLYSDFNGGDPDDAPTGLTVGQMLAQTHQHAWYARSAAGKALEIAKELEARPAATVEPIDYRALAKALLAEVAQQ